MTHSFPPALVLALVASAAAPAQVNLSWKLNKGDRFFIEEAVGARQTVVLSGNVIRQQIEQTRLVRYTVVTKDDAGWVLEKKIERSKAEPASALLAAFEGAVFRIVVNTKGEVEKLQGYDEFVKRTAREDAETSRLLRTAVTEDSLRTMTQNLFAFTPSQEVTKGDRWHRTTRIGLGPFGTMTARNTFTLQGEEESDKNLLRIGITSQFAYVLPAKDPAGAFSVTEGLLRSDESEGTLWFHQKLGRLARLETRRSLRGTLTISTAAGTQTVELTQHQTTKMRVLDRPP